MIEFIKLGAFAQIITISAISSIATLIFKLYRKTILKKQIYLFNILFNVGLILFENIILFNWYGNLLLLFDIGALFQLIIYSYGCICVSQLFYDKAKEINKELKIDIYMVELIKTLKNNISEGIK